MQSKLLSLAGAAALLAAAACSDSTTAVRTDGMTADEARSLVSALDGATVGALGVPSGPWFSRSADGLSPAAGLSTADLPFDRTGACPSGGTLRVAGHTAISYDPATRNGTLEVTATSTPAACAGTAKDGAVIALTGKPSTLIHATASATGGVPGTLTVTQKGAFAWTRSTGGSGTCNVDLTTVANPTTQSATVTGDFCGVSVNVTHTAGG
ncbi:MAG: hypothetical protein JWM27_5071 [Gemmatimonadetes bacterium]|nr:hypothetical protein [Gemmatimonadota bacterium]